MKTTQLRARLARWTTGDTRLLMGLLWCALAISILTGVLSATGGTCQRGAIAPGEDDGGAAMECYVATRVQVEPDSRDRVAELLPSIPDGARVTETYVTLALPQVDTGHRLLAGAPGLLASLLAIAIILLLMRIVRSLRDGDPFVPANARRLLQISLLLLVGGMLQQFFGAIVRMELMSTYAAGVADPSAKISFLPALAGMFTALLAEVFRRGAAMRAELAEVV